MWELEEEELVARTWVRIRGWGFGIRHAKKNNIKNSKPSKAPRQGLDKTQCKREAKRPKVQQLAGFEFRAEGFQGLGFRVVRLGR